MTHNNNQFKPFKLEPIATTKQAFKDYYEENNFINYNNLKNFSSNSYFTTNSSNLSTSRSSSTTNNNNCIKKLHKTTLANSIESSNQSLAKIRSNIEIKQQQQQEQSCCIKTEEYESILDLNNLMPMQLEQTQVENLEFSKYHTEEEVDQGIETIQMADPEPRIQLECRDFNLIKTTSFQNDAVVLLSDEFKDTSSLGPFREQNVTDDFNLKSLIQFNNNNNNSTLD